MAELTKIVIPVAGLGPRVLPASKVIPKEMLTVVDKPVIQYVIEEAVAAGFREIILRYAREQKIDRGALRATRRA